MRLAKPVIFFAAFSCVGVIQANAVFTLGNVPQPGEENVLLNGGTTGMTVFGETNMSGIPVQFTSTQILSEPSMGAARILATNGTSQIGLINVNITVPGHTYDDLIFDPNVSGTIGDPGGTLHVLVTTEGGMTFPFAYM